MATTKGAWKLQEVRDQILAGQWAVGDVGELWSWGSNASGQLGQNNTIHRSSPVQVPGTIWKEITDRRYTANAIKGDNTLWSWGYGNSGQIGDGTNVSKSSPVQIPGTQWKCVTNSTTNTFALKENNTLWGWGQNIFGSLGFGGPGQRNSPAQIPGASWCSIGAGYRHTLATKSDGTLWTWGSNCCGELGIGSFTTIDNNSPQQVPGTTWVQAIGGGFESYGTKSRSFARKTDGTLWAWGDNALGFLGDGTRTTRNSPIQVPGTQWNNVTAGGTEALARKTDGTLWRWGSGRSSPVQIPGTQWNNISTNASGSYRFAAIKNNATLWIWGNNDVGALGQNDTIHRTSPTQVPGTSWLDVTTGTVTTLAIKN
jgi:alpha-tubulin suppressor-like RCC1 family protein